MKHLPVPPAFILTALLLSTLIVRLAGPPDFTDAYYHFNAATRLASGQGLTDAYLWHYIGAPDSLPSPSHLYWMPLTSLSAAAGMLLLGAPGSVDAAQLVFIPMLAVVAGVGFWLGRRLGGSARHGWLAGLLTLASGFFVRFWGAIDTFTPYAFAGALALLLTGLALERSTLWRWAVAGACAALGHLARADGMLLAIVGVMVILWPWDRRSAASRLSALGTLLAAYLLVMSPWFVRNINAVGSALPVGGTQAIWFRSYDDLFSYPPDASPTYLFADGADAFISSRLEALSSNLGTFVVVEGMVIFTPLMLIGLWKKRRETLLRPFWLYALGLHLAMTFVFPFPGYRGGLFHSAAALVPFWMALAGVGLDSAIDAIARRRRRWQPRTAKQVFSGGLLMLAVLLSAFALLRGGGADETSPLYVELRQRIPEGARVMINDPAGLYYHTGLGGVVLPNEAPQVILDIARRYRIDYVLIEFALLPDGSRVAAIPVPLDPLLNEPPPFLTPVPLDYPYARLYAIDRET